MTSAVVAVYLAAIVTANLLAAEFGPSVTVLNAFLFIGLDLSLRDHLHDKWQDSVVWRMAALIAAGGALSYLVNFDAGRIAVASTVAFVAAASADALVYNAARHHPAFRRMNESNVAGAALDSLLFPWLAFGSVLPWITAGQFAAKVAGGFVWATIILGVRHVAARHEG